MAAFRACCPIVLALFLVGCSVVKRDLGPPVAPVDSLSEDGETHYGEVLRSLGPPDRVSALSVGMAFLYEHLFLTESTAAVTRGGGWFNLSAAWLTVERETLLFVFDDEGILRGQSYGERVDDLGSGADAAFLAITDKHVSSSDIDEDGGPYEWGSRLLESLPRTLNDEQSPSVGDAGVQQRGTATNVGQNTLEMR